MRKRMNKTTCETIYECFEETVKGNPDKTAIVYLGTKWTYSDLRTQVERFAASLKNHGVEQGEKIVLYLPNIPQWIIAFFAVLRLKAVAVPVSTFSTSDELTQVVKDCQPKTIISIDTNFGYAIQAREGSDVKRIVVATLDGLLPKWKQLINKALKLSPAGKYFQDNAVLPFPTLLRENAQSLPPFQGNGKDLAVLCYTGGTTGTTKVLPFSNQSFLETVSNPRETSASVVPLGKGVVLLGRPLNECFGMVTAASCLVWAGEKLALAPEENVDAFMAIIQREKVTHLLGSPELFREFLGNPRYESYDLSSLKYCFTGGDSLPVSIAEGWANKFKGNIYPAYIITEACGTVSCCPPDEPIPSGSTGKIVSHKRIKFIHQDTLKEVPEGEPGEILISSENMIEAYWNDSGKTDRAFVDIDGTLWFRTGDIGRVDENGWLYFVSRSADIIQHQEHTIIAADIERALEDHPAVIRAAVVGVKDPDVGERIKGYLILMPGVQGITSYKLIEWCKEKMAPHMVPQYIEFRDMLPTSKAGKLLKKELLIED
jgi:long-chain acyl-CoA synthetase